MKKEVGKDELLIEVYVRELLKLTVQTANSKEKIY